MSATILLSGVITMTAARGGVLAPDYQVVARSSDPKNVYLGSPALAKLSGGRLVATYDLFRNDTMGCVVLTSDDNGESWTRRATVPVQWASPFVLGKAIYLLGSTVDGVPGARSIAIARSDDQGETWTDAKLFGGGSYTGACVSVLIHNDRVYRAYERQDKPLNATTNNWSSVVVAGDIQRNLLDPASWRISNEVTYPGTPSTLTQGLFVHDKRIKKPRDGWLEGNIIERDGRLLVLFRTRMQAQTTANMTSICEVTDDGEKLVNRFVQFYPMPGGQNKFHIVRDPRTGIYWTSTTQVTDAFQDVERLLAMGFKGTGGNERRVQVLMYSGDALHWFQAGFVALSPKLLEAFSYAWLMIDGDDLLVMCRTSKDGLNNHDTNLITLHRVREFRSLVPDGLFAPIRRIKR